MKARLLGAARPGWGHARLPRAGLHTLESRQPLVTVVLQGHDVTKWSSVIAAGGEELSRQPGVQALGRTHIVEALSQPSTLLQG